MADAAVSFAVENVGGFLIQEAKFLWGVKDEVEEMQIELEYMQCFLEDAQRRKGENRRVQHWVSEIREATYDVEDLIERFFIKSALRDQKKKGVVNRVKYASCINLWELHQVGSRIKDVKAKLTTLRKRLKIYGISKREVGGKEVAAEGASALSRRRRQDYSHVVDRNIVGLAEKTTELVQHLLDVQKEPVVCLYGMGGLGKTTTAKQVYKNNEVRGYFEGVAWVYISQQFNPRKVLESILTQLSSKTKEGEVEKMSTDGLTSKLFDVQKEKRCLVVIDDIWQNQDWDKLSAAFPYTENENKSKILLTSRNRDVVSDRVYCTSLNTLDHSCSLDLLKKTISSLDPDHPRKADLKMLKCAEEMVKQCGGLPLAITVLGGILATKHDLNKWEKVGANIKSVLKGREQERKEGVSSVLESSYEDLPYNLRSCFLYFSQYPEDREIKTTPLKQKWIGEGFVSPLVGEGDETMEDIAEEYLDELVRRCMIQVGKRGHTGRVKTCRIHDLMRDLCISKAREEGFAFTIELGSENEGTNLEKVSFRRLCISSCNHKVADLVLSSLGRNSPQLRSLWFQERLYDDEQCKVAELILKNLKSVRVLDLPDRMGQNERKQIGNLIHLRYLNLEVPMLPTSFGNLICLQTLNLKNYYSNSDIKIPDSVWRMEKLRHLYLPCNGGVCESAKQVVGDFKNLQTLENFPPANFDLEQNLVKFINVRKLVITERCEEICNILQRSPGMVFNRLESLSFSVDLEVVTRSCPRLSRLVVGPIKFTATPSCSVMWPSNLTKLVLWHSGIDESHMRSLGKLQSLKVLFLYRNAFRGKQMIFHKNDFPQLQHLSLHNLEELNAWAVHEGSLPSLSCLEIDRCRELESVGDGIQYLKQLKELKVTCMPLMFKKRLEEGGEDWDGVKNVPSIRLDHCYGLSVNSSLELLNKRIGPNHPLTENAEMKTSAREMVKICEGEPWAINILGGILARKHETKEWESIELALEEGWERGNDVVTSVLELSYEDLQDNLKSCFLYFSQYLIDEEIKTSEMIQRWIGEGFVTDETMEDVAQQHLNELVSRGLIEVGERSHSGRVKSYRMDEFVWHFCVSKAEEEGFALSLDQLDGVGDDEGTILEKVNFRRLCIYRAYGLGGSIISSLVEISPQLESVWFQDNLDYDQREAAVNIVKNLKSVKVLKLPGEIWNLLDESGRERVGNLVDLTFLKLGGSELPKTFGNLRCLQTLNLETCVRGTIIPDSVWGMEQLRHLYLPEKGGVCESRQQQVGHFSNLQTLVNFPPCNFDLRQNLVKFSNVRKLVIKWVGEMGRILRSQDIVFNRLQSLSIKDYYTNEGEVDLEAFSRGCPCLYRLFVKGSIKFPTAPSCTLIWPSNLTKLVLVGTQIDESQLGSIAELQSLKVLFLHKYAFAGKEMVFHKNDFPQLLHLVIDYLEILETWSVEEGALPNLRCLGIVCCRKLKSVPDGCQYLKQMKELRVKNMPHSFRKRLEEGGEDRDRVSHIPSISFIGCDYSRPIIGAEEETEDGEQSSADCCLEQRTQRDNVVVVFMSLCLLFLVIFLFLSLLNR